MQTYYRYVLTDIGNISATIEIQVECKKMCNIPEFHLTQPALINRITETIPLKDQ
jgi:hypothetical protein